MSLGELYTALSSPCLGGDMWRERPQDRNHIHKNQRNFPRFSLPKEKHGPFRKKLCNLSWNSQGRTETHAVFATFSLGAGEVGVLCLGAEPTWSEVMETEWRCRGRWSSCRLVCSPHEDGSQEVSDKVCGLQSAATLFLSCKCVEFGGEGSLLDTLTGNIHGRELW